MQVPPEAEMNCTPFVRQYGWYVPSFLDTGWKM